MLAKVHLNLNEIVRVTVLYPNDKISTCLVWTETPGVLVQHDLVILSRASTRYRLVPLIFLSQVLFEPWLTVHKGQLSPNILLAEIKIMPASLTIFWLHNRSFIQLKMLWVAPQLHRSINYLASKFHCTNYQAPKEQCNSIFLCRKSSFYLTNT